MAKLDNLKGLDKKFAKEKPSEAEAFLYELEQLIDEEHVQYGRDTLEGIKEWVEEHNHVTDGQRAAVRNIDEGGQKRQRRSHY